MQTITIETAKFTAAKSFDYSAIQTFPSTAKGLTLAVIAAERMMNIDAYQAPFADIRISYRDGGNECGQLDDAQLFDLIAYHRHHFSILEKCQAIIDSRAAVSIERNNKLKIARAAIEDMIEAGYFINAGSAEWSKNADEIMKGVTTRKW